MIFALEVRSGNAFAAHAILVNGMPIAAVRIDELSLQFFIPRYKERGFFNALFSKTKHPQNLPDPACIMTYGPPCMDINRALVLAHCTLACIDGWLTISLSGREEHNRRNIFYKIGETTQCAICGEYEFEIKEH